MSREVLTVSYSYSRRRFLLRDHHDSGLENRCSVSKREHGCGNGFDFTTAHPVTEIVEVLAPPAYANPFRHPECNSRKEIERWQAREKLGQSFVDFDFR